MSPAASSSPTLPAPAPAVAVADSATANGSVNKAAQAKNQHISLSGTPLRHGRQPSVQFAVQAPRPLPLRPQKRMSSPPPPTTFQNRVSFDTFDNKDAVDFSLTLNAKHRNYTYTRRSRTFLCGTDQNDYSEFALEWLIDELVDDGDEIVCLRVVDKDSKISSDSSLEEGRYRLEAKKLLDQIIEKNSENKAISLILEFAVGKIQETIQRMICIYEPAILIVGTRGRSLGGLQGLLPGSVSKYCLQHSPVPVIVVRPTSKREKKKKKRQADPTRRGYLDILEKSSGGNGKAGHVLDHSSRNSIASEQPSAGEGEALAVAEAVGLNPKIEAALEAAQAAHAARIEALESSASPSPSESPVDGLKDSAVVMKSPDPEDFESPESSESDEDGEVELEAQPGDSVVEDMNTGEPERQTDPEEDASASPEAMEGKDAPAPTK